MEHWQEQSLILWKSEKHGELSAWLLQRATASKQAHKQTNKQTSKLKVNTITS